MLAPEGYPIIGFVAIVALAIAIGASRLPGPWGIPLYVFAFCAVAFALWFFRDPARTAPEGASKLLLAPADGKVIIVDEIEEEPLYLKSPAKQVSIFLSPLNVHVNRSPATGVIEYDEYVAGQYLVAWHPKSSELNERSQLGLLHESGRRILFKQIAGAVARRVVYHVTVGDSLEAGERFGIVRFGSRMDILVPTDVVLSVQPGDRVVAGETVIGHIPDTPQTSN
ncbi:MAG: phosphatidylserine decarboxylase family protein [Bacteroidetes bacterium]|nr:phosphatidylserine decarboxylase family protein [Bacteroidota bacterium]